MSTFRFCNECAIIHGILPPYDPVPNLSGSTVVDKFMKHTQYQALTGWVSIFNDPSYDTYKGYYISSLASGSCTVYQHGTTQNINANWFAGQQIGITYHDRVPIVPANAVVVAWANDPNKVHCIPYDASNWHMEQCQICHKWILVK